MLHVKKQLLARSEFLYKRVRMFVDAYAHVNAFIQEEDTFWLERSSHGMVNRSYSTMLSQDSMQFQLGGLHDACKYNNKYMNCCKQ